MEVKRLLSLFLVLLLQSAFFSTVEADDNSWRVHKVKIRGVDDAAKRHIRRKSLIKTGMEHDPELIPQAETAISKELKRFGFYQPSVQTVVNRIGDLPLVEVIFKIKPGYQATVKEVVFSDEFPEDLSHVKREFLRLIIGHAASAELTRQVEQYLRVSLRNEGYLQASVKAASPKLMENSRDVKLEIDIQFKEPVTFYFQGNEYFSGRELLEPLRLDTRSVPFTPNAVRTLCREIENKYQKSGFLNSTCEYKESGSQQNRKLFDIIVSEGDRAFVEDISFQGNETFRSSKLQSLISTTPRGWLFPSWRQPGVLTEDRLEQDVEKIEDFYRRSGFRDVDVSADWTRNEDEIDVVFTVEEGERSFIEEIVIEWVFSGEPPAAAYQIMLYRPRLDTPIPFGVEPVRREQERLTEFLFRSGYPAARVEADYNEISGELKLIARLGSYTQIGEVSVSGTVFTNEDLVRRELVFKSGEEWDVEKMLRSQQRLFNTGFYRSVNLKPKDDAFDAPEEDVRVEVVERDTGSLAFEVGYDTVDGIHLAGELAQRNIAGTGNKLSFAADGYVRSEVKSGYGRAQYSIPHILGTDALLVQELYGRFEVKFVDQFSYDRAGYSSTVRFPLKEGLSVFTQAGLITENVYDVDPEVIIDPVDTSNNEFASFSVGLDLDKRNSPHLPRRGYRTLLTTGLLAGFAGSDVSLIEGLAQQSVFLSPFDGLVWANNFRFRLVESFGVSDVVPLSRRIFLGGRESLRGFGRNKVGPLSESDIAVGGDRSIDGTTEFRFSLTDSFVAVVFFDYGVSYLVKQGDFMGTEAESSDFRYSPGVGLWYETPVGPLSLEYGFALNRSSRDDPGRILVSIGNRF